MSKHCFQFQGITQWHAQYQLPPPATITNSNAIGALYEEITLTDDAVLEDLKFLAMTMGWAYVGPGAAPPYVGMRQLKRAALGSDAPTTLLAVGWSDVPGLAFTLTTKGGTILTVDCTQIAGVSVGGQGRLLISGGSFVNAVMGPSAVDLPIVLGNGTTAYKATVDLPATAGDTTYTVRAQVRAVGALSLGTTARAGSSLFGMELA